MLVRSRQRKPEQVEDVPLTLLLFFVTLIYGLLLLLLSSLLPCSCLLMPIKVGEGLVLFLPSIEHPAAVGTSPWPSCWRRLGPGLR